MKVWSRDKFISQTMDYIIGPGLLYEPHFPMIGYLLEDKLDILFGPFDPRRGVIVSERFQQGIKLIKSFSVNEIDTQTTWLFRLSRKAGEPLVQQSAQVCATFLKVLANEKTLEFKGKSAPVAMAPAYQKITDIAELGLLSHIAAVEAAQKKSNHAH